MKLSIMKNCEIFNGFVLLDVETLFLTLQYDTYSFLRISYFLKIQYINFSCLKIISATSNGQLSRFSGVTELTIRWL